MRVVQPEVSARSRARGVSRSSRAIALCAMAWGAFAGLWAPRARASVPDLFDRPMSEVWPARRAWDAAAEREFGEFVAAIGRGVAEHRCGTLARCLSNPRVNPLYVPARRPLRVHADCGDVPYTLRAFFAFRRGLPFVWARDTVGAGRDRRYRWRVRPVGQRRWTDFRTPRALFGSLASDVDSGFYRMAPHVDGSDTYPTRVDRTAVRPGTVYYNPNGHVLIVWRVDPDGSVHMIDGHPDNSITYRVLTERYPYGSRGDGGGFRNWRPLVGTHAPQHASNAALRDLTDEQYDRTRWVVGGAPVRFQRWVRARLASKGPR